MAKQIVMYATGDTSLARASRAFDAQHVQFAGNIAKGEIGSSHEGRREKSLDSVWAKVQTGPVEMPSQGVRLH
jgi:hypothetical protein